jgi:phosphomannomutase
MAIHAGVGFVRQAVILAGGQATRLRPYTDDRPKAMVPVAGRPIVDWQLDWLAAQGVDHVVLSCGYLAEVLTEHLAGQPHRDLEVTVAVEEEPLGRGGALRFAAGHLPSPSGRWLALNGDVLTRFRVSDMLARHRASAAAATIALAPYRTTWGIATLDDEDRVAGFVQSPVLPYWINGGIYCFEPEVVDLLPERGDHEDTTFPLLAAQQRIAGFRIDGYWRGVDTLKDVKEAGEEITNLGWRPNLRAAGEETRDVSTIVKAYDIRGLVPDELDGDVAQAFGAAFVLVTKADAIVVGRDMRPSSPGLAAAFAEGAASQGADVVDIGLASTDQLYFATGRLDLPGAMFTASHNPARYNGIKLCRAGAAPVGQDSGLAQIRTLVEQGIPAYDGKPGRVEQRDVLGEYGAHLRSLVDLTGIRPLRVVVDAGNGMAGHTVPAVFSGLPLDVVPLYFELDGSFPNHEANPIDPGNLRDLLAAVLDHGADLGLAFDGDADRCFVVDERGEIVTPSTVTALIAARELAKEPGAAVIHNLITSRAVPEIVREHGGTPVRTRVGHSFIKATMAETGAIFGGEHSGHFYFRDFWRADSGMLAALHTLAALGGSPAGTTLSHMLGPYERYVESGEVNSTVDDPVGRMAAVREAFGDREDVEVDELDGLTVQAADWWFNLRPSNTEPLLRLNVEAADQVTMQRLREGVLAIVRA